METESGRLRKGEALFSLEDLRRLGAWISSEVPDPPMTRYMVGPSRNEPQEIVAIGALYPTPAWFRAVLLGVRDDIGLAAAIEGYELPSHIARRQETPESTQEAWEEVSRYAKVYGLPIGCYVMTQFSDGVIGGLLIMIEGVPPVLLLRRLKEEMRKSRRRR